MTGFFFLALSLLGAVYCFPALKIEPTLSWLSKGNAIVANYRAKKFIDRVVKSIAFQGELREVLFFFKLKSEA
ncbi:MAG: hypothetical protein ACRCT1_07170 [Microcoleaceae cyanobacterium]